MIFSTPTCPPIFSHRETSCKPISDENVRAVSADELTHVWDAAPTQRSLQWLRLNNITFSSLIGLRRPAFWEKICTNVGFGKNIACHNLIVYVILMQPILISRCHGSFLTHIPLTGCRTYIQNTSSTDAVDQSAWSHRSWTTHSV